MIRGEHTSPSRILTLHPLKSDNSDKTSFDGSLVVIGFKLLSHSKHTLGNPATQPTAWSEVWHSGPRIDMHLQMEEEEEEGVNYQCPPQFGSVQCGSGLGLIKLPHIDRLSTPLRPANPC